MTEVDDVVTQVREVSAEEAPPAEDPHPNQTTPNGSPAPRPPPLAPQHEDQVRARVASRARADSV